jgi:hypothetical protein
MTVIFIPKTPCAGTRALVKWIYRRWQPVLANCIFHAGTLIPLRTYNVVLSPPWWTCRLWVGEPTCNVAHTNIRTYLQPVCNSDRNQTPFLATVLTRSMDWPSWREEV